MSDTVVILRIGDMIKKLKIAKSTLYDWMNMDSPRYNAEFPGLSDYPENQLDGMNLKLMTG